MSFSVHGAPKPILRWAGSKKRSLEYLLSTAPEQFERYIEPFAGSACLFFNLLPPKAVLGDINPQLIEFYRTVTRHGGRVFDIFSDLKRNSKTYYRVRDIYPSEAGVIRRAAYFFYLNRNCFNGIFRVNKSGKFNVPFSNSRVPAYPTKDEFLDSIKALASAKLDCSDFMKLCNKHVRKGDFVYLDPPYYVPKQRVFREYVPHDFASDDVARLSRTLQLIDARSARFLMNYPDCDMMRTIARRWSYHPIEIRRTISGKSESRGISRELLIYNF
jgi:DNA adenine methylase